MSKCTYYGCYGEARWSPVLLLYAAAEHGDHPPAEVHIPVPVCDLHKNTVKADSLLSPNNKEMLAAKFAGIGKACPDFARTGIRFEPWDGKEGER